MRSRSYRSPQILSSLLFVLALMVCLLPPVHSTNLSSGQVGTDITSNIPFGSIDAYLTGSGCASCATLNSTFSRFGNRNLAIAAPQAALSITTNAFNPSTATVGVGYGANAAVAATGGQTPYSWSATGFPNGMSINSSSGAPFGTPTVSGTFNVTVTVRDSSNPQKTASKVLTLTVNPASSPLSITTNAFNPSTATVGVGYGANAAVAATGGQTPYSWSATGFPNGMSINSSSGAPFGTPTVSGTFNVTVTVRDSSNPQKTASKVLTLTVNPASSPLSITTNAFNPSTATVGVGYGANAAVAATGGQTPYSWSATGFPNGMSINSSSGAPFGTPTVSGTFNVTVTVRDSSNPQKTASKVLTLTVNPASSPLSITTNAFNPSTATVGVGYGANAAVAATGGQTPYSWSATGFPNGMSINSSSGAPFGTPTVSGTFNVTVTVRDSSNPQKTASKVLTLTVNPASSSLSITTTALNPPTATVGVGYGAQQAIAATGGQTPYSWSASGLPNGMGINSSSGAVFGTPTVASTFNFTVTVRDSSGPQQTASKVLSLTVNPASSSLSITTTAFNPATAAIGVGYAANTAVTATGGQTPYSWSATGFPNGMSINSSSGAPFGTPTVVGTFNVTVTVRDSSSPQKTASKVLVISVAGATTPPTINSISPGVPQVGNSDQNVTVNGSNFQAPITATVFFPGGGSTNLSGAQIQNVTSTSFVMRITFGSAGAWSIRVSNPAGTQSNTFTFTVQSTVQSPTIGSINPTNAVVLNSDQDVAVYGNNFQQNLTVSVTSPNGGVSVTSPNAGGKTLSSAQTTTITTTTSSSFLMRIRLFVAGVWMMRVINPDGRQSNPFSFTVVAPTGLPNISSINPATLTAEQTNQSITVIGSHFQPALTVDVVFPNGQGTTLQGANQVQNITSTSFVMHIALSSMGNWSIRVKNPDASQSTVFPFTVSAPSTGTCSMQVTRLSQGNPDWNQPGQKYDSIDKTIGEMGCALTSLTMALNFAGIQIDPGTLNAVMIGHGGYDKSSVNWKPATSYISNDQLKFDELRSRSLNKLEDRLCQGYPVVVGVDLDAKGQPGHFVLVTGKEGDEFTIKDPGYVNRTKLTDYNSIFESRGSVVPKNFSFTNALNKTSGLEANVMSSLSDMTISVGGNAELLIIDAAGRRTGYDPITGAILEEIPNSVYFRNSLNNDETGELDTQSTHSIIISQATPGAYTLIVTGQDSGASEVSVTSLAQDGSAQPGVSILSVTQSGSTATYQINVAPTASSTMQLMLEQSGTASDQAAAVDSVLFFRDPFQIVNGANSLSLGVDRNTRVTVFVTNLQLEQGENSSSVVVNLIDSNNQSYEVAAEDVRLVPNFDFTQVIFRLPNNLPAGTCTIKIKAHGQVSNLGTIRIRI